MSEYLIGARVELSTPEGEVYRFCVRSLQSYACETFAVLVEEKQEGQLLVTHVETDALGAPVFVVVGEEDIITAVLEKQVAETIMQSLKDVADTDEEAQEEE